MSSMDDLVDSTGFPAWDPKSPGQWFAVTGTGREITVTNVYSDTGAGCNCYETPALIALLDARDEYLRDQSAIGKYPAMQRLCRTYCQILSTCCEKWEEFLLTQPATSEDAMDLENKVFNSSLSAEGLELLKNVFALTQLSGTFLLLPKKKYQANEGVGFNHYTDLVTWPGAATADTVRFLRLHSIGSAEDAFNEDDIEKMNSSYQPDQWDGGDLFWALVEKNAIQGRLEQVWVLLSNHSMLKRVIEYESDGYQDLDEYRRVALEEDRNGFLALKSVLLSAPIPGGRNSDYDSIFAYEGDESTIADLCTNERDMITDIPLAAYRMWDLQQSSLGGDSNIRFDPLGANRYLQRWKEEIMNNADLNNLRSRMPKLDRLLNIMCGNFRSVTFGSWQEELCAELLYSAPRLDMDGVQSKTQAFMDKHKGRSFSALELGICKIMKGNAGRVIDLAACFGGQTNAALPAVMTALLAQLFLDSEALVEEEMKECTLHAASAIQTSFAAEVEEASKTATSPRDMRDVGTRLTVKLLLPFIEVDGDVRYAATLVDMLEHHFPENDSDANEILSLCENLVERKNVRILDGCDSICLARYIHYKSRNDHGSAVRWLLKGVELEALLLCGRNGTGSWQNLLSQGLCFRNLVADCFETAQSMLKYLVGDEEEGSASMVYKKANEMVTAHEIISSQDTFANSENLSRFIPAMKILEYVTRMAQATSERLDTSIIADCIVACLEEKANDEDEGTVSSLAPPCMQWDLLRLATLMMERDASKGDVEASASFDVKGMGVLLSALTINIEGMQMENRLDSIPEESLRKMRLAFAEGLKRSYIAENAMKTAKPRSHKKLSAEGKFAANFDKYSREEQELAVQKMLDVYY